MNLGKKIFFQTKSKPLSTKKDMKIWGYNNGKMQICPRASNFQHYNNIIYGKFFSRRKRILN